MRRCVAGDREAFAALYERSWAPVHAFVLQQIGDWDEARSVAQEVFLTAWRSIGDLREPERFAGWIRTVAASEVRRWRDLADVRARERRRPVAEAADVTDERSRDPGEEAVLREFRALVLEEIRDLPPLGREATLLRLLGELPYEAIGERLGIGTNQAKGLAMRGMAKVSARLGERMGEEEAR